MRIAAIYRLGLTWVTLPVSLLVGLLYVGTFTPSGTGVPLAEQATAFLTGAIVLPIICLGAAMSASRLRQARLLDGSATVRRSWLHVFAALVLPPAVAGVVAFLAPVMWFTQAQTGSLLPHPIMVAAAAAHAAAYVSLAVALGTRLRPLVAVPLAVLLPFVFIGFPQGFEPRWLRHLTQIPSSCCEVYNVLDPQALTGLFLVAAALTVAAYAIFRPGQRALPVRAIGLAGAAALLVIAVTTVDSLPYQALVARPGAPRCEPVGRTALCVWPEHEHLRANATPLLTEVSDISARTGVSIPTEFTETIPDDVTWPRATIDIGPGKNITAWVRDGLDPATTCRLRRPANGSDRSEPPNPASSALRYWWARELGEEKLPELPREVQDLLGEADTRGAAGVNGLVTQSRDVACGAGS